MLFEPYNLAGIELKNRIVRSATYEKRANEDGFVTDALIEFYKDLTRGGVGLIITGNALVHVSGRTSSQMTCIHNDFYIDKLKRLTNAVHRFDGKVILQLIHGGRQCFPDLLGGENPIAPSEVHDPSTKITPREMTNEEIWEIIDAFGDAARRAMYAGFDGIQIHGAHGYLVSEFLSPHTNRRDDYWGGDEGRRFHFVEEIYKAMRKEVGNNYPILIKMNVDDFVEGGLEPEESVRVAKRLEELGMDAVEVSGGMYESKGKTCQIDILKKEQEAYFRKASRLFKKELNIPVILVGGIRSKNVAEDVLQRGDADLISMSRPLIREPDLPNKFMQGKEKADCISCNGCLRFKKLDVVKCVQLKTV
ncbi:MAG: NADH:flavin oxidoreductase [Thermodesulfovibrionales bacterium]|nr:NADH:flavin oxidoreductase [Thermodesulfovibrionales bacterium]